MQTFIQEVLLMSFFERRLSPGAETRWGSREKPLKNFSKFSSGGQINSLK